MNDELEQLFTDGQLKCMEGDLDAGIAIFSSILEKQPMAKAHQARAACYAKKECFEDAMKDISGHSNRATKRQAFLPQSHTSYGQGTHRGGVYGH